MEGGHGGQRRLGQAAFEKPGDGPGEDGKVAGEDRGTRAVGPEARRPWARAEPHRPPQARGRAEPHGPPQARGRAEPHGPPQAGGRRHSKEARDPHDKPQRWGNKGSPSGSETDLAAGTEGAPHPRRQAGQLGTRTGERTARARYPRGWFSDPNTPFQGCPLLLSQGPCRTEPPKCLASAGPPPLPT